MRLAFLSPTAWATTTIRVGIVWLPTFAERTPWSCIVMGHNRPAVNLGCALQGTALDRNHLIEDMFRN
jgi:hypothetical protein